MIASQAHRASLCTSNPSQQQASCRAQQHLSTPEQHHWVFPLCPKPPLTSQQLAQVVAGLQAPADGQARRLPMGNHSERVRLPSGFNALHPAHLSFSLAQRALSWSNHSTGQASAQQDLTRWGLRLGWSQRLSVTHPKESGVHGSGWRLPSGVLRAQLTVPLGAGSCTNTDGEYSSPVWLETLTWTESLGHGGYQDSLHSRPLCLHWPLLPAASVFLPLCRSEAHFGIAKHPFPTSSPPAKLCYPAVHAPCPAHGHQKHMHTHADLIIPSQIQRGPRMMCCNIQLCFSSCSPAYKAHSFLLAEVLQASSFAGQCFSAWALQTPGCFVTLQN